MVSCPRKTRETWRTFKKVHPNTCQAIITPSLQAPWRTSVNTRERSPLPGTRGVTRRRVHRVPSTSSPPTEALTHGVPRGRARTQLQRWLSVPLQQGSGFPGARGPSVLSPRVTFPPFLPQATWGLRPQQNLREEGAFPEFTDAPHPSPDSSSSSSPRRPGRNAAGTLSLRPAAES